MFKIANVRLPITDAEIKHFCSDFLSESNRITKRIKMKIEERTLIPIYTCMKRLSKVYKPSC